MHLLIRYLPQEPQLKEHLSALEAVLQSDSALARCVRAYEAALQGADEQARPLCLAPLRLQPLSMFPSWWAGTACDRLPCNWELFDMQ